MKAYKYIKKEHAKSMTEQGQVRVGTIYEYRGTYENNEIGDSQEGKINELTKLNNLRVTDPKLFPESAKDLINISNLSDVSKLDITFKNFKLNKVIDYPDAYIYCVTLEPNRDVMLQFQYDACIEIEDINKFGKVLTMGLIDNGYELNYSGIGSCMYDDTPRDGYVFPHVKDGVVQIYIGNYWLKPSQYIHQKEHRITMIPKILSLEPLVPKVLTIEALSYLCKEIDLNK